MKSAKNTKIDQNQPDINAERRTFLTQITVAFGAIGAIFAAVPFLRSMGAAGNVKALSTIEVDLTNIAPGQSKTVLWQGKPVFISHRTAADITLARQNDTASNLIEPAKDEDRVQKEAWLVVMGVCTHLGCVPLGNSNGQGWRCPCHGSQFDNSGRLTRGPAARNLDIPPYKFINDNKILIG